MKIFYSFIISCISVLGYSQTILYQSESTSRIVQDPQSVVLTQGFHAKSDVSNPFIAKVGPSTENPGGGPIDSGAGAGNPTGTTETTDKKFHDTKGNIEVNGAGQLQFTLPIALPPGVKTVAPQMNLVYTSGSGNGIAGYGWNLSGITAISRIGKSIDKDGGVKGIQLDYSDYYSFNGQRLILKSGEYGKDGAEYVTEKYSNVKIKSIGTIAGQLWQGPEYWEVTFEDGSQAWYGGTASGNSAARTPVEYNIVKWKDAHGNYITYNYTQSDNVAVISSIQWGGNEVLSKSNFNTIEFNYFNERTLKEINYLNGIEFIQKKLLKEIKVKSNENQFKRYAVEYGDHGTSYQLVSKIFEYNANDQSANPITFAFEPNPTGNEETSYPYNITNFNTKKYADFNMDGIADYIEYVSDGVIKYKNSVYLDVDPITLQYDSSKFTSSEFAKVTTVTFKKNNFVKNSIGIVIPHKITTADPKKPNYEFQVYSVDISNSKLNFEYSKVIPYSIYNPGGGIERWF